MSSRGMSKADVHAAIVGAAHGQLYVTQNEVTHTVLTASWDSIEAQAWWMPSLGPSAFALGRYANAWVAAGRSAEGIGLDALSHALGVGRKRTEGDDTFGVHHPVINAVHRLIRMRGVNLSQWGELEIPDLVVVPRPAVTSRWKHVSNALAGSGG